MQFHINNSFTTVKNATPQILAQFKAGLSYHNDFSIKYGQIFKTLKKFKALKRPLSKTEKATQKTLITEYKNLKAKEYVCWFNDNKFPTGHLPLITNYCKKLDVKYELIDERVQPESNLILKWDNPLPELRYYQKEMIEIGKTQHRGVFHSCVGSGKTYVMLWLLYTLKVKSLIIVPSTNLLDQIMEELEVAFGGREIQHITTKIITKNKPLKGIRVVTIATLNSLRKQGLLPQLLEDVHAFYGDEFHHAGATSWTAALPEFESIYYRFGFTGSFTRNDKSILDMLGVLSTILYTYTPKQAIQDGFLTPIKLQIHNVAGRTNARYPYYNTEYGMNYCAKPEKSNLLPKLLEIIKSIPEDKQILILVDRKDKAGYTINSFLDKNKIPNVFVSGDQTGEVVAKALRAFNDKKLRVLIGSKVIGEGIDIRSTDHLIMCQGGKSNSAIIQAVGRLVRLYPNKNVGYLHDFNFINTKYLQKHLVKRIKIYKTSFGV